MKMIPILDTSISSPNLGDSIIMDAVLTELRSLIPRVFFMHFATHEPLSRHARRCISSVPFSIVGGTNLLSSAMNSYSQWKVSPFDSISINNAVLMGVGWWQYQEPPNLYTRILVRRLLHNSLMHSVRDNYTAVKLAASGINNVLVTGCPTLWGITEQMCREVPSCRGESVVITLTDYMRDIQADQFLIKAVSSQYKKVYFWPQGLEDISYLKSLTETLGDVVILPPSLKALDSLLDSKFSLDYVGTRLHAGIRALQYRRRTIIVAIDNRAAEMGSDFGLPIVHRSQINTILDVITSTITTKLQLPWESIALWKSQFTTSSLISNFDQ